MCQCPMVPRPETATHSELSTSLYRQPWPRLGTPARVSRLQVRTIIMYSLLTLFHIAYCIEKCLIKSAEMLKHCIYGGAVDKFCVHHVLTVSTNKQRFLSHTFKFLSDSRALRWRMSAVSVAAVRQSAPSCSVWTPSCVVEVVAAEREGAWLF